MSIPRGFHSGVVVICPSKSYQSELLKAQADREKRYQECTETTKKLQEFPSPQHTNPISN